MGKIKTLLGLEKPTRFLGLDISSSSLKVVELEVAGSRPKLTNYGWAVHQRAENVLRAPDSLRSGQASEALAVLLDRMQPQTRICYGALPGSGSFVSLLELPPISEKELPGAVQLEAKKIVPVSVENVVTSWDVVAAPNGKFGKRKNLPHSNFVSVLFVVAQKEDVLAVESVASASNAELFALEVEYFSFVRALVSGKNMKSAVIIADIGDQVSSIVLVSGSGVILAARNFDVGGNRITRAIADVMKISFDRADRIKTSGEDLFSGHYSSIVTVVFEMFVGEIERIREFNKKRSVNGGVSGIILSGGSAKMAGLGEYLMKKTGLDVEIGDPWKGINVDRNISSQVQSIGPSFSTAVGLALRGIMEHNRFAEQDGDKISDKK